VRFDVSLDAVKQGALASVRILRVGGCREQRDREVARLREYALRLGVGDLGSVAGEINDEPRYHAGKAVPAGETSRAH
jgi:hypothetical protein